MCVVIDTLLCELEKAYSRPLVRTIPTKNPGSAWRAETGLPRLCVRGEAVLSETTAAISRRWSVWRSADCSHCIPLGYADDVPLLGTIERTTTGAFLLATDPTRGLELPVEKNPKRPVCDAARLDALMAVADQVIMGCGFGGAAPCPSYFRSILRLAHDTGRRISSVLALSWADWKPELGKHGKIRWGHESDKIGRDWLSPVTVDVREELTRLQRERLALGGLIFPSANNPTKPVTLKIVYGWLWKAEKLAGLDHLPGGGFHAFRRGWASSRKHLPLKDVAEVGGWTDTATLLKCYITTDDETQEEVVSSPRRIQKLG